MSFQRFFRPFLIAVLFISFAQSAFAQSGSVNLTGKDLLTMDLDDLDKAIKDAKLFRSLKEARIKLERKEYCGKHADKALETKEELEQLNLIRNKTTETYGQRAMEVKDENNKAIRDYENCYKTHLSKKTHLRKDFLLRYYNILTFQSLEENYFNLVDRYKGIANLDEHIDRMQKIYKMRKETAPFGPSDDEVIGTLASAYNSVEVLPGGKGAGWLPVGTGYKLTIKDHLRTGYSSMAGIQFSGSVNQGNAQSTVVNVHSNSHIVMEKFTKAVFGSPQSNTERVISLLRGSLHAIKKTLNRIKEKGKLRVVPSGASANASKSKTTFNIRAGDSTAVIRGTELGVLYNSETGIAEYHLDHGDAYVESGERQVQLKPRTSLTVSRGQIGTLRPLSNAKWDRIVANSGGSKSEGGGVSNTKPQRVETAELETLENNDIAEAARARRNYAKSIAKTMLLSMKNYDKEALLNVLHGSVRSDFEKDLRKTTLKEMSDQTKGRPISHTMPCSICNKKGDKCQVLADVQMEADPIGQLTGILFDIETNGHDSEFKVDNAPPADYAMIKTFMARNPFCGEN